MIRTEKFTFGSAPKTGCRWFRYYIKDNFLWTHQGSLHLPESVKGLVAISFVRDPATWLRSYYQNFHSLTNNPAVDSFLPTLPPKPTGQDVRTDQAGLNKYIRWYLDHTPQNSICEMFLSYPADHRWRMEDMPKPLEAFLGLPPIDLNIPNRIPTPDTLKLSVPEELRQAIYKHEPELVNTWSYN